MIRIVIPGPAVPEAKKTFGIRTIRPGRVPIVRVDLPAQKDYKAHVKACMAAAMDGRPPLEGPLSVRISFYRLRPKSAPKRVVLPATRPDLNNCVKLIEDAGNALVWRDDAQIVTELAEKRFSNTERVEIEVSPTTGDLFTDIINDYARAWSATPDAIEPEEL